MQAIKYNASLMRIHKLERIHALHEQTNPRCKQFFSPRNSSGYRPFANKKWEAMIQKNRAGQ